MRRPSVATTGSGARLPVRDAHRIFRVQMPRAHPRWGIEFDWLGVDREGHVAVFTTAGYGPVPAARSGESGDHAGTRSLFQADRRPDVGSAAGATPGF